MITLQNTDRIRSLWSWWTLATAIASAIFMPVTIHLSDSGLRDRAVLVFSALILSMFQWLVLRRVARRSALWILATVGGAILSLGIAFLFQESEPFVQFSVGIEIVAILQALVLKRGVRWGIVWILAKIVAFVVTGIVSLGLVLLGWRNSTFILGLNQNNPISSMLFGAVLGLVFGMITGIALQFIFSRSRTNVN